MKGVFTFCSARLQQYLPVSGVDCKPDGNYGLQSHCFPDGTTASLSVYANSQCSGSPVVPTFNVSSGACTNLQVYGAKVVCSAPSQPAPQASIATFSAQGCTGPLTSVSGSPDTCSARVTSKLTSFFAFVFTVCFSPGVVVVCVSVGIFRCCLSAHFISFLKKQLFALVPFRLCFRVSGGDHV